MNWISVEERLPMRKNHNQVYGSIAVLVTDGVLVCESSYQYGGAHVNQQWAEFCNGSIDKQDITHWMYLPEPPK